MGGERKTNETKRQKGFKDINFDKQTIVLQLQIRKRTKSKLDAQHSFSSKGAFKLPLELLQEGEHVLKRKAQVLEDWMTLIISRSV